MNFLHKTLNFTLLGTKTEGGSPPSRSAVARATAHKPETETHMNDACKKLKIVCIISLIVGVLATASAIALIVVNHLNPRAYVGLIDGVLCAYMGFQCARKINVPSNAPQIRNMSSVMVLVMFFCAAYILVAPQKSLAEIFIGSTCVVMALLVFVLAKKVVAILDAK